MKFEISDINECDQEGSGNICEEGQTCLNTFGGHRCYEPSPCEDGFHRSQPLSDNKFG